MIDLHVHSTASDGTLSPAETVNRAGEKKLSAIALTDHDTVSGLAEAMDAGKKTGVEVIPGIEMSCLYREKEIHILGYFIDIRNRSPEKELHYYQNKREERNDILLNNLEKDGIHLTRKELQDNHPQTMITRAHFARCLVRKGYAGNIPDAFKKYLVCGGKYCPERKDISAARVMEMFREYQIWPSLAHPFQYHFSAAGLEELLSFLTASGLRGLEVWHSTHHPSDTSRLLTLADSHQLIPTGGSDFHGSNKPDIDIGTGFGRMNIPDTVLENIKNDYRRFIANDTDF